MAKNTAGIALMAVATVSIKNVGLQPACPLTMPISICPRILPKPAIPSIIPETVAKALWLFFKISCLPRSHSMAAIIILEPFRAPPRKNITVEIRPTPEPWPPQRVRTKVEMVEIKIPRMKTGDLMVSKSVERPIRMLPKIDPKPKRLKMFADTSLEKSRPSWR